MLSFYSLHVLNFAWLRVMMSVPVRCSYMYVNRSVQSVVVYSLFLGMSVDVFAPVSRLSIVDNNSRTGELVSWSLFFSASSLLNIYISYTKLVRKVSFGYYKSRALQWKKTKALVNVKLRISFSNNSSYIQIIVQIVLCFRLLYYLEDGLPAFLYSISL